MLKDRDILAPLIEEAAKKATEIRRDLHMHPELSGKEVRTGQVIADTLRGLNIETRDGMGATPVVDPEYAKAVMTSIIAADSLKELGMSPEDMMNMAPPQGNGVLGTLYGEDRTKAIAIRADIDALPIAEAVDSPFKSLNPGVMHACGHDVHTATLLGTAMVLKKYADRGGHLPKSVKFIFQPNEEGTGGAAPMIAEGAMKDPDVESVIGIHVDPTEEYGKVKFFPGVMNAACTDFKITVFGKACHGAHPEFGIDPIPCACDIVLSLQTIVSRKLSPLSPAVVTIGAIRAGTVTNQVPDRCEMIGTIRTLENESLRIIEEEMRRLTDNVAKAHGCTCETVIGELYPVLDNDPQVSGVVQSAAEELVGAENLVFANAPSFGSDDFAFFSNEAKGCYFTLGSTRPGSEIHDIHSDLFDPDERMIKLAIEMEVYSCLKLMEE
ncbi:MAG: amidohydrolase [Firmicutes bacterium]|nr:amidohydrolase [Bacillota bacterium]